MNSRLLWSPRVLKGCCKVELINTVCLGIVRLSTDRILGNVLFVEKLEKEMKTIEFAWSYCLISKISHPVYMNLVVSQSLVEQLQGHLIFLLYQISALPWHSSKLNYCM